MRHFDPAQEFAAFSIEYVNLVTSFEPQDVAKVTGFVAVENDGMAAEPASWSIETSHF